MTKRYSQKWQRYFIKMLFNEPFFYEREPRTKEQEREARVRLAAASAICSSVSCHVR